MPRSRGLLALLLAPTLGIPLVSARAAAAAEAPDQAMMAGMDRMNRAMADAPMTGDPDHDFVAMMIPHHQGAISMAQVELRYGRDPALRRLAKAVVAAQQKEIAEMRNWHPQPRR